MGKYLRRINCGILSESLANELAGLSSFSLYALSELLERSLSKYEARGIAIVNIDLVDEPLESVHITESAADALVVRYYAPSKRLVGISEEARKRLFVAIYCDALREIARSRGWDVKAIDEAEQRIVAQNFSLQGRCSKYAIRKSPPAKAWLAYELRVVVSVTLHVVRGASEVTLEVIPSCTMSELKKLLELTWESEGALRLAHERSALRCDYWIIDLNENQVTYHLERAARGDAHGQYDLALLYEQGAMVPRNRSLAIHWLSLAAAQGYKRAIRLLEQLTARSD
jgi:Sel1 repeat-containing protein